jgi:hypothetical protein
MTAFARVFLPRKFIRLKKKVNGLFLATNRVILLSGSRIGLRA